MYTHVIFSKKWYFHDSVLLITEDIVNQWNKGVEINVVKGMEQNVDKSQDTCSWEKMW